MKHRTTPIAAALLAAFATPLLATEAAAQAKSGETALPEVKVKDQSAREDFAPATATVGGKTPTTLRDIPQTVTVINRAVLDSQGAASIADALVNVPGITMAAGEGGNIGDNINLRGFSARTDIFIDGFRDRGQYSRDTFYLDSVEVLKGPSSMLFGRGSTGGVINQVSKKPMRQDKTEVGVRIGTHDYYRVTADLNRKLAQDTAFRVAAFGQDVSTTRDVARKKDYGVAPSLRLGMGTPTEITLSALVQRNRDIPDYGVPVIGGKPANTPRNNFYGFNDDKFNQDVNVVMAKVQHKLNADLTLSSQLQYGKYRTEASPTALSVIGTATASTPLSQINVNRNPRDRVVDQSALYNQTDLIAKLALGGMTHTLTTGFEIGREEYENRGYTWTGIPAINLGNPVYGPKPESARRTASSFAESSSKALGAYLNDQIDLNAQWKLVAGVRWDRFETDYKTTALATSATTALRRTDRMTSVRGGVLWQPSEMQSYYLSYGTSFNPSSEADTLSTTNAGLKPEKNRSIEAGAKLDLLDGNLALNASVFRVEKTNARTTDSVTGIVSLDGNIRVNGFELSAMGRITPQWQIYSGYTFLDGRVEKSNDVSGGIRAEGKRYQNTPRHTASLWTTYRFLPEWEAGGGLVYTAKRYLNNYETAYTDGYTRVDATVAYLQKNYDVRLNLQNAGNTKYFEAANGGRATPAKGRTVLVSLNYRF